MQVDSAGSVSAPFESLEAVTRLKGYLSALRRRWYLIVIPMILGAALGWLSTPETPKVAGVSGPVVTGPTYYRASHILIDESQGTSQPMGQTVNLSQAAYLVNTGEVPKRVAAKLGLPLTEVASSLIGLPRSQVSSVEVQAVGLDPEEAVKLADTAAAELLVELAAQAKSDADANRDRIISQLDKLDTQINDLNAQIAANPPDVDQLMAQQRSLTNQYSLVYEQFAQLANQPPASAGLTSLEGARPVKISKDAFNRTKATIRDGADYVTGNAPATTVPSIVDDAPPSTGASAPVRALFGGLTGLVLGAGLVLLLDRFDSRLRRRSDVELVTGLPVVAEIPPLKRHQQATQEVVAYAQHRSRAAEAYRVVRGALLFTLSTGEQAGKKHDGATVVMVSSANPGEGKTTTVANLAAVLAEGGFTVLVINCDFRRPRVHLYLLEQGGKVAGESAVVARVGSALITNTILDRVRLVTGLGEDDPDANPLDVVAMQRKVIQATRSSFDVILLDTAPVLTTNDASELLSETDQVLVVVRAGKTKVESARRAAEVLRRFEAPVVGVVLNDSVEAEKAQYYYGTYTVSENTRSTEGRVPNATATLPGRVRDDSEKGGSPVSEVGAPS